MRNRRRIRITESDLRNVVSRSVARILKENDRLGWSDDTFEKIEQLKDIFSGNEGELVDRICGKIDEMQLSGIADELLAEYGEDFDDDIEEDMF